VSSDGRATVEELLGDTRPRHITVFHLVAEGKCWLERPGYERVLLSKGDVMMLPFGDYHEIGNGAYTVIGHDCHIDEDAVIDGAIVWPNSWIDREASVGAIIAGRHCHFGRNVEVDSGVFGDKSVVTDYSKA
jgi:hypothetical protein